MVALGWGSGWWGEARGGSSQESRVGCTLAQGKERVALFVCRCSQPRICVSCVSIEDSVAGGHGPSGSTDTFVFIQPPLPEPSQRDSIPNPSQCEVTKASDIFLPRCQASGQFPALRLPWEVTGQ